MWADLQRLRRAVVGLYADHDDEQETFELAQSARRFSRRTKERLNDKLSFSAVLMRAGEVDAANRLIEELQRDVRAEEAALIEQMNEVRIARTMRRQPPTRARLAHLLVAAALGATVMASSALGTALSGMLREVDRVAQVAPQLFGRGTPSAGREAHGFAFADKLRLLRKVRIARAEMLLSPKQLRMLEKITSGAAGDGALEQLLAQLQLPPDLAAEVRQVLSTASAVAASPPVPPVEITPPPPVKKKGKKKAVAQKSEEAPAGGDETPQPEPSPSPSPSSEDKQKKNNGGEGDVGGDSGSESEETSGPPLPGLP